MDNTSMMKDHGNFNAYDNLMGQFPISSMNARQWNGHSGNPISYSPYNEVAKDIESNGGVWGGAYGGAAGAVQMAAEHVIQPRQCLGRGYQ